MVLDLKYSRTKTLRANVQVQQAYEAYGMICFIARRFYKSKHVLLQLEVCGENSPGVCVQLWSPFLTMDILSIEGMQQTFTRLIPWMV